VACFLTWILTGLLTISAALSYGELPPCFPRAGGPIRLFARSLLAALGISLRLDAFPGDPDGTIAAVAVGFARYLGVLLPAISPNVWVVHPIASVRSTRSAFRCSSWWRADDRVPDIHQ